MSSAAGPKRQAKGISFQALMSQCLMDYRIKSPSEDRTAVIRIVAFEA